MLSEHQVGRVVGCPSAQDEGGRIPCSDWNEKGGEVAVCQTIECGQLAALLGRAFQGASPEGSRELAMAGQEVTSMC